MENVRTEELSRIGPEKDGAQCRVTDRFNRVTAQLIDQT